MTKQNSDIEEFLFETWQLFDDYISSHNRLYQRIVEMKSRNSNLLKQLEEKRNNRFPERNDYDESLSVINRSSFILDNLDSASPSSSVTTMLTAISELPRGRRSKAPKRSRTPQSAIEYIDDYDDEEDDETLNGNESFQTNGTDAKKRRKNENLKVNAKWNSKKETDVKKRFEIKECAVTVTRLSDEVVHELTSKTVSEASSFMNANSESDDSEFQANAASNNSESNETKSSSSMITEDSDDNIVFKKAPLRVYARKKTNRY